MGFLKAIVNADTNQISGAAVLGIEGGEVMTVVGDCDNGQIAIHHAVRCEICSPWAWESLNNLFMAMDNT
ncbi:MAG TPA: hypothetical protein VMG82_29380 [Candidatus Sulfotelmatobacter sp.]|nr:hypothetical protein [Candidatus Sulfotelmatobacter sp.]